MERDALFCDAHGFRLDATAVAREIVAFMRADTRYPYKVMIGTDSEALADHSADFVTAIVVHRVGNGGRYFWRRVDSGKFFTLRDRIIREVVISLDAAKEILEELQREKGETRWSFEIHADIGENGATKVLMQEVLGMIRGSNFEARTKPESYAASKVADRYV